jgi:hypothetical protein
LLVAVAGAFVVRVAVELAYRPALFFSDSWVYLRMAYTGAPVGVMPSRPSGYPLALRALMGPTRDVMVATMLQHAAGIGVGVLLYGLLVRLRTRPALAALAAAVVMFDSYGLALEQFVMADAFFTLLLVASVAVTILRRNSSRALAVAGVLLAIACTLRTSGLFVVPVWLVYLVWTGRRRLGWAIAGLAAPLVLYLGWHAIQTGGSVRFDQAEGWFLYGRVASIADCRGAAIPPSTRPLCDVSARERATTPPGVWIWGGQMPADRLFGGNPDAHWGQPHGEAITARDDGLLQAFALAIIRDRPLAYLRIAGDDFLSFFNPHASTTKDADDTTVTFPSAPLTGWVFRAARNRYLPGYVARVHWPASALVSYQKVVHAPRALLGLFAILAAIAFLAPALFRGRLPVARRPEIFLLAGGGLAMLVGSAALVGFVVRYLIPSVPLLLGGGLVAMTELMRAAHTVRGHRAGLPSWGRIARVDLRRPGLREDPRRGWEEPVDRRQGVSGDAARRGKDRIR